MIRLGDWKLSRFGDETPLLFDLSTDPDERINRIADLDCRAITEQPDERIYDDWNPEEVALRMRERRIEKDILAAWASEVQPEETYVWRFSPAINRLDNESLKVGKD